MDTNILLQPNNNIPIAIMEWASFLDRLPNCFQVQLDGTVNHDRSRVNVFTNTTSKKNIFCNAYDKEIRVKSYQDLEMLRQRLLTLPIFVQLTLERKRKVTNLKKRLRYMVCLNPLNPVMRAQLEEKLDECAILMQQDCKFSLEVNLGYVIRYWYRNNEAKFFKRYHSNDSTICITNHVKRKRSCYNPKIWMLFLPVMVFVGPIYIVYRAVCCKELRCRVEGIVTKL